jgi:hypothetical protein
LIKLCKKYDIKLKGKKFKNKTSKHLDIPLREKFRKKLDLTKMEKCDQAILKIFKYYNREYHFNENKETTTESYYSDSFSKSQKKEISCFSYSMNNFCQNQDFSRSIEELQKLTIFNNIFLQNISSLELMNFDDIKSTILWQLSKRNEAENFGLKDEFKRDISELEKKIHSLEKLINGQENIYVKTIFNSFEDSLNL